jgi:hypothetical protein
MGRKKGSLTPEQKAKMQAGRKAAKAKAQDGIIPGQEIIKKIKIQEATIIGYALDIGDKIPYPVFASEKDFFKGKIYPSVQEAKEAMK